MRASAVNGNNAYNRTDADDAPAPKKAKESDRAGGGQAADASKPAAESKREDVAKSIEDAKSRVEQKGAQYEQRAEGKAALQKLGDNARERVFGDRDDQGKNIRITKEALSDIQQQQQSGKLSDVDAAAKVKETESKFEQEFTRVEQAQQTNAKVGQILNVAGREISSTAAGLAAAGGTTVGTLGLGTLAAPVAGVATKVATSAAWDANSKLFFEGKAGSGFTGQNSTSIGNLAVRGAQGEKITTNDVVSAGAQTLLDGVGGGSAVKSAKTLSTMKEAGELTGKFAPDVINFGIKNAPNALTQTAASNAINSGKIAVDPTLSDQQKADGVINNTLKAPSQGLSNVIGGSLSAGQLSNPVATAANQFGTNTATDLGRTVFENSAIDKKQTDGFDLFSSAVNGASSALPGGKRADTGQTGGDASPTRAGSDAVNSTGATQRSDSAPASLVDAQANNAGGGGDEPPKGIKRTSSSPDEPNQPTTSPSAKDTDDPWNTPSGGQAKRADTTPSVGSEIYVPFDVAKSDLPSTVNTNAQPADSSDRGGAIVKRYSWNDVPLDGKVSDAMRAELSQPIIGNPVASSLDRTTTPVLERDMFGNEIFYRTMSQEHYEKLQKTGNIQKTAETSIAPLEEYSSKYQGVLVRIVAEPGTADKLREIAVSANDATSQRFNDLEDTFKGWGKQQAQFKVESIGKPEENPINMGNGVVNINLGKGAALEILNDGMIRYEQKSYNFNKQ
jgi:hypothetical protein